MFGRVAAATNKRSYPLQWLMVSGVSRHGGIEHDQSTLVGIESYSYCEVLLATPQTGTKEGEQLQSEPFISIVSRSVCSCCSISFTNRLYSDRCLGVRFGQSRFRTFLVALRFIETLCHCSWARSACCSLEAGVSGSSCVDISFIIIGAGGMHAGGSR